MKPESLEMMDADIVAYTVHGGYLYRPGSHEPLISVPQIGRHQPYSDYLVQVIDVLVDEIEGLRDELEGATEDAEAEGFFKGLDWVRRMLELPAIRTKESALAVVTAALPMFRELRPRGDG